MERKCTVAWWLKQLDLTRPTIQFESQTQQLRKHTKLVCVPKICRVEMKEEVLQSRHPPWWVLSRSPSLCLSVCVHAPFSKKKKVGGQQVTRKVR